MKRIQSKITVTYVALMFAVVVSVGVLSSWKLESYYKEWHVGELTSRAGLLVSLLHEVPLRSPNEGDKRLKDLARVMNLRITLIDSSGLVILDSEVPLEDLPAVENHLHRPEVQGALAHAIGIDTRRSATVGKDFLYVAKRLDAEDTGSALLSARFIRLSERLEDIDKAINEIRWSILGVGAVALLLATAVSVFISRRIASPMVAIASGVKQIRAGNLETRIEVQSTDEIGLVAEAVNEMVEQLKADVTQLRKLERARGEFLGNVSHELRTPIFSILGFLETLLDGGLDDPNVNRAFLQKAYGHATRLNTLLGDLMSISQMESGEMKMSYRYFSLKEFLRGMVHDFQPVAERRKIRLALDAESSNIPLEVLGDKERLSVALANLIENAIKYNTSGGEVVVSYTRESDKTWIVISDTGVGIPEEHLPRIFERFYRVDTSRSREVGGTGLGLAIVKHIVEAHGSSVVVQSEVGRGSVFRFSLRT